MSANVFKRADGQPAKGLAEIFDEENFQTALVALNAAGVPLDPGMEHAEIVKLWLRRILGVNPYF